MAEDHHLRPARSILLPLQRFHLRRRDHARTQLRHSSDETKHSRARWKESLLLGYFDRLCWRNQKSAHGRLTRSPSGRRMTGVLRIASLH